MGLTYLEAREALAADAGIPFEDAYKVRDEHEIADALGRIERRPVVVKANLDSAAHKFRLGAVRLDCMTEQDVQAAISDMRERVAPASGSVLSFIVEPQLSGVADLLLGAHVDPEFGPVLVFGAGGSGADHFDDHAVEVLPLPPRGPHALLRRTRVGSAVLAGEIVDATLLLGLISCFAEWFGANWRTTADVDVNPLRVVSGSRVVALDARVIEHATEEATN